MDDQPVTNPSPTPRPQVPLREGILSKIFLNEKGVRGVWRLLIYTTFVAAIGFGGSIILQLLRGLPRGVFYLDSWFPYEAFGFTVIFGAALIMARVEGETIPRKILRDEQFAQIHRG